MVNRCDPRSPGKRPRRLPATPAADDLDRLTAACAAAATLLPILAALMPEPSSEGPATGTIGRHAPESSEPWQAEAAHAYFNIHFGARRLRGTMRTAAGLVDDPVPSGSDRHTLLCLKRITALGSTVDEATLAAARRDVESWVTQARRIRDIDQVDTWQAVPRIPGAQPPACPYCHTLSLRMSRVRQEVRCFFPECTDYDGQPTRARMEPGRLHDHGQLVFGDGTVVAYREELRPTEPEDSR